MYEAAPPPLHKLQWHVDIVTDSLKLVDHALQLVVNKSNKLRRTSLERNESEPSSVRTALEILSARLRSLHFSATEERQRVERLYDSLDCDTMESIGSLGMYSSDEVRASPSGSDESRSLHSKYARVIAENKQLRHINKQLWDTVAQMKRRIADEAFRAHVLSVECRGSNSQLSSEPSSNCKFSAYTHLPEYLLDSSDFSYSLTEEEVPVKVENNSMPFDYNLQLKMIDRVKLEHLEHRRIVCERAGWSVGACDRLAHDRTSGLEGFLPHKDAHKDLHPNHILTTATKAAALSKAAADAFKIRKPPAHPLLDSTSTAYSPKPAQDKLGVGRAVAPKEHSDTLVLDRSLLNKCLTKAFTEAASHKQEVDELAAKAAKAEAEAAWRKQQYDTVVQSAAADKAAHDQLLVDAAELREMYNSVVDSAAADKVAHDHLIAEASELHGMFDRMTSDSRGTRRAYEQANASNPELKPRYDHVLAARESQRMSYDAMSEDTVEFKHLWDALLEDRDSMNCALKQAGADAALHKQEFDQLALKTAAVTKALAEAEADAVERKRQFDEVLEAATADKAAHDKLIVDAADLKGQFDHIVVAAAEDKAAHDKLIVDAADLKGQFDHVVVAAAADKAVHDKLIVDAADLKGQFDHVVVAAAADKAAHEKLIVDATDLKGQYDVLLVTNQAVTMAFSKAVEDVAQVQAQRDKVIADAARQKQTFDVMLAEGDQTKALLRKAAKELDQLKGAHGALLRQQEMLQNELALSMNTYKPMANVDAGTPAEKMMQIMTELMDGKLPIVQDIVFVKSAIMESRDLYQPINFGRQLMKDSNKLDEDVSLALIAQLGNRSDASHGSNMSLADYCSMSSNLLTRCASGLSSASSSRDDDITIQDVLKIIISNYSMDGSDNGLARCRKLLHSNSGRSHTPRTSSMRVSDDSPDSDPGMQQPPLVHPSMPIIEDVERVLALAEDWQYNAFELNEVTQGHPLSTLAYYLFHRSNLIKKFQLKPTVLARALRHIEMGYSTTNPYHSCTHAADVLQSVHVILHRGGLMPGYVDGLTLMACYLAATVHDYEHAGLTNDFLINSGAPLAVLYNDKAPLENHHCAAAFGLLRQTPYDFLSHMSKADRDRVRKIVIDLVLGTDMKQHFNIIGQFKTVHRLGCMESCTPSLMSVTSVPVSVSSADSNDSRLDREIVVPLDDAERILSLQMMLKCADLGHVATTLPVHLRWVSNLEEEFFRQGDREKDLGLPISPLFDRSKQGISKSQVGFLDIVCIPLFQSFTHVFTTARPMLAYLMRNYDHWIKVERK